MLTAVQAISLWCTLILFVVVVTACASSEVDRVSNPAILEPISDATLREMVKDTPAEYRAGKLAALRASVEKSKNISDAPVAMRVGEYSYHIPMNYITQWGDFRHKRSSYTWLSATLFLPDFRGYDRTNFIDPFHPDKIELSLWPKKGSGSPEAEIGLKRLLDHHLLVPADNLNRFGLVGYSSTFNADMVWMGTGNHGHAMFIECSTDALNNLCQVDYHHRSNRYWLFYHYKADHLHQWREIDDKINRRIIDWRKGKGG